MQGGWDDGGTRTVSGRRGRGERGEELVVYKRTTIGRQIVNSRISNVPLAKRQIEASALDKYMSTQCFPGTRSFGSILLDPTFVPEPYFHPHPHQTKSGQPQAAKLNGFTPSSAHYVRSSTTASRGKTSLVSIRDTGIFPGLPLLMPGFSRIPVLD